MYIIYGSFLRRRNWTEEIELKYNIIKSYSDLQSVLPILNPLVKTISVYCLYLNVLLKAITVNHLFKREHNEWYSC